MPIENQFDAEHFYLIGRKRIIESTTPDYRSFLRKAGYGDLNSCFGIGFAKGILKYNQDVRNAASRIDPNLTGNDGAYVVSINHQNARKLVEALGFKVLTVGLMYNLFIPYIKDLAQQGNVEAQATLKEMTNTRAEWLEDLVLDKKKVKIGSKTQSVLLPDKDGRFDRADMNDFGYPTRVKDQGEFYHWSPRDNERAAIRYWVSELFLVLDRVPSIEDDWLGVRVAKFF